MMPYGTVRYIDSKNVNAKFPLIHTMKCASEGCNPCMDAIAEEAWERQISGGLKVKMSPPMPGSKNNHYIMFGMSWLGNQDNPYAPDYKLVFDRWD